ncbi:peptidylprolyl isomerase [Spartinivicinus poritis]|uniref:Peptidyl-prolyl cis-trans isomerase n=1 Tax=Spartinivicinus poritis TaxID=2994640 RepID=A0ABT5UFW1_9GAMM|nr:peptidylprolyl isomerase [Spartinivicinus sp. A2-2]MDE1463964.1 peptidylprolyl isomerase [Spartinivicinus sp. A2-2]
MKKAYLIVNTLLLSSWLFISNAFATNPVVVFETNKGHIELELYANKAPISVKNFLQYVNDEFYNGLIFHRVIPGFMIQGGGFDPQLNRQNTRPSIKNEANNGLKNLRGTIAMARLPSPDTATSQFFINLKDNAFLDHGARDFGYAVFGKVTAGIEVVDTIAKTNTGNKQGMQNVPVESIIIKKAWQKKQETPKDQKQSDKK